MKRFIVVVLSIILIGVVTGCMSNSIDNTSTDNSSIDNTSEDISSDNAVTTELSHTKASRQEGYNVKDFGAKGDGKQLDSPYIQMAADQCVNDGGGTIIIPAGKYLCASIRLYSNTTVIFDPNAEVILCDDESEYGKLRGEYDSHFERDSMVLLGLPEKGLNYLQEMYLSGRRGCTDTLFFAMDAENISIIGTGTINGQWEKFYYMDESHSRYSAMFQTSSPRWLRRLEDGILYYPKTFRAQIINFVNCSNVKLDGFTIQDGPFFNVHLVNCSDVRVQDINILSDIHCVNTDGINLYGCERGFIRNCRIVSGDDSIALSGNTKSIVISDTIAQSSTCFIRLFNGIDDNLQENLSIGSEEKVDTARLLQVKDVNISNCVMEKGGCFLLVYSAYGSVENIQLNNISSYQTSGDSGMFLCIQKEGQIKNIRVNNFNCEARGVATIMGTNQESVQDIYISNARFLVNPRTKMFGNGMIDPVINYWVSEHTPYNLYIRHARNVNLSNVEIIWGEADLHDINEVNDRRLRPLEYLSLWREDMNPSTNWPAIDVADVTGLTLSRVTCEPFGDSETIRLRDVDGYKSDD